MTILIAMFEVNGSPVPEGGTWDSFLGYPPNTIGQVQFMAHQPDQQGGWANYDGSAWYIAGGGAGDRTRPMVLAVGAFPFAGTGETQATIEQAATGAYNQHYTDAASNIAQYWPNAIIRPMWEFNGTWYPWSRSLAADQANYPANFIATFKHIVQMFRAVSPGFTFAFNPNLSPGWDSQPPWDCFPGAAYCQYAGIDCYDNADPSHPDPLDRWNTWQQPALDTLWQQCQTWGVPPCIPEWGCGAAGDNPLFMDKLSQWCLVQSNFAFQGYWNDADNPPTYAGGLNNFPLEKAQYLANWKNTAPAAATTWNPNDLQHVALSNNNLTAAISPAGSGLNFCRSTGGKNIGSGKWYFEVTLGTNDPNNAIGLANANADFSVGMGGDFNAVAFNVGAYVPQYVYINNAVLSQGTVASANGDVVRICWDSTAKKIWVSTAAMRTQAGGTDAWNNDILANQNPATGTGGIDVSSLNAGPYMIAYCDQGGSSIVTLNTRGGFDIGTPPAGFQPWD